MILQLLQLLLISLGFENKQTPKSLYPQPQYSIMNIKNPRRLILLTIIAMIIFTVFVFMFMPGTESGNVYYHMI